MGMNRTTVEATVQRETVKIVCDGNCGATITLGSRLEALDWIEVHPIYSEVQRNYNLFFCPSCASSRNLNVGKHHPNYTET